MSKTRFTLTAEAMDTAVAAIEAGIPVYLETVGKVPSYASLEGDSSYAVTLTDGMSGFTPEKILMVGSGEEATHVHPGMYQYVELVFHDTPNNLEPLAHTNAGRGSEIWFPSIEVDVQGEAWKKASEVAELLKQHCSDNSIPCHIALVNTQDVEEGTRGEGRAVLHHECSSIAELHHVSAGNIDGAVRLRQTYQMRVVPDETEKPKLDA